MVDLASAIEHAIAKLRAGAVQEADDLLADILDKHQDEQVAAGILPPPLPPTERQLLCAILTILVNKAGAPADLEALVQQFNRVA
jgi:hypothetical protein